ncbi:MAG: HEPN domain-containing protein [Candidatus Bathyarchaeia archaeon]
MTLEELLKNRIISRIDPNRNIALKSIKRAKRDIEAAKTLIATCQFDWSLAVSYNAMLAAGRALMFDKGYRPSSTEGHLAVVQFLTITLGEESGSRMVLIMNGMRKKRHRIVYEEMDIVSLKEAKQAVEWAEEFIELIANQINQNREM